MELTEQPPHSSRVENLFNYRCVEHASVQGRPLDLAGNECFECIRLLVASEVATERERLFSELLVAMAGLGIVTPQEGFKSVADVRWHMEVALKDAKGR